MKRYKGRITIGLILVILAIGVTWVVTQEAEAAEWDSFTLDFPLNTSNAGTLAATCKLFIWRRDTLDLVSALDGDPDPAHAYSDAAITISAHAENGLAFKATVVGLEKPYEYAGVVTTDSTPTGQSDIVMGPFLIDPASGKVCSDTNPIKHGKIITTTATYN